ncbi:MAG: DUF2934 domain-containing protein [Verrucomicrobia bacterium]|nr:MAG: DUF2934 domain-containing protein [Verrucomicrobiota bacterium]
MSQRVLPSVPGDHDIIALVAHQLWDAEGRPSGRDVDHWLEAERQVLAHRHATATEWADTPGTLVPTAKCGALVKISGRRQSRAEESGMRKKARAVASR